MLICARSAICFAGGPVDGSKAAAMGTAFAAVADDPSAVFFNPAGLTQLHGTNFYSGGTLVFPSSEYISPSGSSEESEFQVFPPPHLYATSDFNTDAFCFGLGIYSPFGIGGRKWDEGGITRYISTESEIGTFAVNPVAAFRLNPWISLGAGFYYQYATLTAESMVNQARLRAGDAKLSLEGEGGGWGCNAGILLFPGRLVSFAVSFRSGSKVKQDMTVSLDNIAPSLRPFFGGSSFKTDASSAVDFPQVVTIGIAFRPTDKLTFAFDADGAGWSSLNAIDVNVQHKVVQAGFGDLDIPFDSKDAWELKAGVEYKVNDRLALRGGYVYTQTYVPDITVGPGNPDSNQHGVSLGFGYRMGRFTFDAFCLADFFEPRTVSNDILSGEYRNFMLLAGTSINFKWK
ncbi:MAG: outer membrane protein transport protein [Syntrophobacteraceae bacterium]|nr:outer membrane protein transport protein [Syntrophobacteraceae bacterium]